MNQKLSTEEICNNLRPLFGKKIDDLYFKYRMAENLQEKEEISHFLNLLYQKNLGVLLGKKVLLEPPPERLIDGNYNLAEIIYADKSLFKFKLREKDWPRHVCVSGMSGSGKTTLAFNILESLIENKKPFLVFDWKRSFRPLLLADSNTTCFTIGNESASNLFKININKPPRGINPKEWINILCDLLVEVFNVSFGVHKTLLETLDNAFEEWGVYAGTENYPTWKHIKWYLEEKLKKVKGRESGWVESALRIATLLTFGSFGEVCNYNGEKSFNVEDLFDKRIIFELNSLGNIEKKFFCEFILTYIYKFKKANKIDYKESFDYAILVDEAHNIFLKNTTRFITESVTDMIYREMREYGISLICLDQHISKISDTIKGNSACNIAFQQQLPQDVFDISGLMQMKDKKDYFNMLPVGTAIVKLSERFTEPFLIKVKPSEIRNNLVTDKEILERAKVFFDSEFVDKEIDKDFNKELIGEKEKIKEKVPEKKREIIPQFQREVKEKNIKVSRPNTKNIPIYFEEQSLSPKQKILFDFILKKLKEGDSLIKTEALLDSYKKEGGFSGYDLEKAIDSVLKMSSGQKKTAERKLVLSNIKTHNSENLSFKGLTDCEKSFLDFLLKNKDRDYGITEAYKEIGLSARKGNDIKNKLLDKKLIEIKEIKNDKGWKKLVKPCLNSYL